MIRFATGLFVTRSDSRGFTLIETLIVLAVAGTIISIIFLSVSGLQRSARNVRRDRDAAFIRNELAEFYNNHAGRPSGYPWPLGGGGGCLDNGTNLKGAECQEAEDFFWNSTLQNSMSFYNLRDNLFYATDYAEIPISTGENQATPDILWITSSKRCGESGSTIPGNKRNMVVTYRLETFAGSGISKCIDVP